MNTQRKRKIAILGGGLGALAAAFELTEQPNWRDKYEVTLYQVGWRLGGKAASGRNPHPHFGRRIEEHGLHLFFGCYENAFFLLRRCYKRLGRPWQRAFIPRDAVVWADDQEESGPAFWGVPFPPRPGWPGELANRLRYPPRFRWQRATPPDLRRLAVTWIDVGLRQMLDKRFAAPLWIRAWVLLTAITLALLQDAGAWLLLRLQRHVAHHAARHLEKHFDVHINDAGARHLWLNLRTGETVLTALFDDKVFEKGFDALEDEELTTWLRRHRADEEVIKSPFLRVGYDAVFAFAGGHRIEQNGKLVPDLAAGTALRSMLRAFSYRHLPLWKMRGGMGDVVVMPLYEVLRERGVQFKFFHRITGLELARDRKSIAGIRVVEQVPLASQRREYDPVVRVDQVPCWSSEPDYAQLANGDKVERALGSAECSLESPPWLTTFEGPERTLESGSDFDDVILGISVGGLNEVVGPLVKANSDWDCMMQRVTTTPTLAFQWWLSVPLAELGWDARIFDSPIVGGLVEPVDTWADMTHLVEQEAWNTRVATIAYFCGPLEGVDGANPAQARAAVMRQVEAFVAADMRRLWPSVTPERLCEVLVSPAGTSGAARLCNQYYRANASGTERYVQTPAGSVKWRLRPEHSGFQNLFLAGDWTLNGMNIGCAEAAVMSGMQAARGIACADPEWTPITVWAETDRLG